MSISVIIPTFNESANIGKLVSYLLTSSNGDIVDLIVSDAGSTDDTCRLAEKEGARVVTSSIKGRAGQMNSGAAIAQGDILYFVHADCYPPSSFCNDINSAVAKGYDLGRYRTQFASNKFLLKVNAWFTRFDSFIAMGGDQTLFVKKTLFDELRGFKDDMLIMEEYEFCSRARTIGKYKIMDGDVLVSARKYEQNSWLKVQLANLKVVRMYQAGASQQEMLHAYKKALNYRKNAF